MTTLVTGATGLLGNNLVRMLVDQGAKVRVLTRPSYDPRSLEGLPVEVVTGDLTQTTTLQESVKGTEVVIHSAGFVRLGWSDLALARQINVEGTRGLAQAALREKARFVHVSTVNTLGLGSIDQPADEATPTEGQIPCSYVISKSEAEQAVLREVDRGLDAFIVNPGTMFGPWDWKPSSGQMVLGVATRWTPLAPTGGVSVVDVRDVARGILSGVQKASTGSRYILAGENMTYFQLWKEIATVAAARGPRWRLGPVLRNLASRAADLRYRLTGREGQVNSAALRMSCQFHYYSSHKAETELGYRIGPVRRALQDAWQWFRRFGYVSTPNPSTRFPTRLSQTS